MLRSNVVVNPRHPWLATAALAALLALPGCLTDEACADEACRGETVELDDGEGPAGPDDTAPGCAAVCAHLAGSCGWGFAAVDGDGGSDEDNCVAACALGAFDDDELACLARAGCDGAFKVCLGGFDP